MLAWLSVWSEMQTCIWPRWSHCHSLSLALVKSRLVLPFWYWLTWLVPAKRAVKRVCVCVSLTAVFWFIRRVSTVVVTITEVLCCWYTAAWVVTLELVCSACYSAVTKGLSQNTVHIRVTLQYEQMLAVSLMLCAPIKIRIAIHCCNMWRLYSGTAIGMQYV